MSTTTDRLRAALASLVRRPATTTDGPPIGHSSRSLAAVLREAQLMMGRGATTDAWYNERSGVGVSGRDRMVDTDYGPTLAITKELALRMWRGSALTRRIVGKRANVALSRGVELSVPDADTAWLQTEITRLRAVDRLKEGRWWGNLYGGALVIANCDGGGLPHEPLDLRRLRQVVNLRVVDRWQVNQIEYSTPGGGVPGLPTTTTLLSSDGEPIIYHLTPTPGQPALRIHASRVFRFDGAQLPWEGRVANAGWDDSVLVGFFEALSRRGIGLAALATQLQDSNVGVWKIKDLHNMVLGDSGELQNWLEAIALFRSVIGDYALDAESEDFEYKSKPLADAQRVFQELLFDLAAEVDMPFTELYGMSPAGMNATGESDRRKWHETINAFERPVFGSAIAAWLVPMLQSQTTCPKELRTAPVTARWPSLEVLTAAEEDTQRKTRAETIDLLVSGGVVTVEEARAQLRQDPLWALGEDTRSAGSDTLPAIEKLRQGRLVAQSGLLHAEEQTANVFRTLLGLPAWTEASQRAWREAVASGLLAGGAAGAPAATDAAMASTIGAACDGELGDGSKVGLFIRLPPELARQRPSLGDEDTSPPHVTFLILGDVRGREADLLALIRRELAEEQPICRAFLGRPDALTNREGEVVVYQHVDFSVPSVRGWSRPLHEFRHDLVERLRQHNYPVRDASPDDWCPHLTLAYLADPRATWTGAPLTGSWHVGELEVWGLPSVVRLPLDGAESAVDEGPATPAEAEAQLAAWLDEVEPEIQSALEQEWERQRSELSDVEVAAALVAGVWAAAVLLRWRASITTFVADQLAPVWRRAGERAGAPNLDAWVGERSAWMGEHLSEQHTGAMGEALNGLRPGDGAPQARPFVGLTEDDARTLATTRRGLVEQGELSAEQIDAAVQARATQLHQARAQSVARTEAATAYNAGAVAALAARGRGSKTWHTASTDACPICTALNGTSVPIGSQFDGALDQPPAHPSCRCTVT